MPRANIGFKGPALYRDDRGRRITTHSMLKTMGRCPKQAQYKYAERLKPRIITARDQPLRRGTWFHLLLQEYYSGNSWKDMHEHLSDQYFDLMDEEKDALGDLPTEMLHLMKSYLWHYGANKNDPFHGWEVIDTEVTLECPWPDSKDGSDVYRCRVDVLYKDEWGMWIADHKTHKSLPDISFRLLDAASPLYIWCARECGYPVRGFQWNYIRAKVPTSPKLAYEGTSRERLSTAAIDTDYPTYLRGLRSLGLDPKDYLDKLRVLHGQRWVHGQTQLSPFFRRDTLEKDDDVISRVVGAAMRTRDRMHGYDWDDLDMVERTVDRSCAFACSYTDLCTTELFGGNVSNVRRLQFVTGDPLEYYQDEKDVYSLA